VGDRSRREEVLETASSLIAAKGLGTSMQDIAHASGMLSGSLYYHFASQEALLTELLRRYHADLNKVPDEALATLALMSSLLWEEHAAVGAAVGFVVQ
jgi:AcrR family transcriptional regulator